MKTLIVSYLPREGASNTKKVLDSFKEKIKGELEELDLLKTSPDFFTIDSIDAYQKRNYMGAELDAAERESLGKMDRMMRQFQGADRIVLAFPMHNFSMPAAVKAYFDSILQKGETWDMDSSGYIGLLKDKKALVISSSGGQYNEALGTKGWDFVTSLTQVLLGFMGMESQVVMAQGTASRERASENIEAARREALVVADQWYA